MRCDKVYVEAGAIVWVVPVFCFSFTLKKTKMENQPQSPKPQVFNAAYVKALYAKYPTVKTSLPNYPDEADLDLWVNPFYQSIADVAKHMPLITYELFTEVNALKVHTLRLPRTGVFAGWHPVNGQDNEDGVYTDANQIVKKNNDEIAKGHCEAWVLNAFSADSAILSDTYTFNAAAEDQGQNVGTEIATEDLTRKLLETTDVCVWCGTWGSQGSFTDGKDTDCYPAFYWKILKYKLNGNDVMECFWMPNEKGQVMADMEHCVVPFEEISVKLGFDPTIILPVQQ